MKYLVIDTESSDLFDFSKPADGEGQPRLAELAMIYMDENLAIERISRRLIKPNGWEMQPGATAKNGLTTAYLQEKGEDVKEALLEYSVAVRLGYVVAAYNAQFDTKVMRGELRRAGMPDLFEETRNICLMRACTPICRIPKKSGAGWKFPKLEEACAFFEIEHGDAHTAEGDALAAAEILKILFRAKKLPAPEVHYAKERPAS